MSIYEIPTPSILVEKKRLESNISSMQKRADEQGVNLRPHIKTHKSLEIAKMQLAAGAKGITVAKASEAEVFVGDGFTDVRIAYPVVGPYALGLISTLSAKAKISFCVDTPEGLDIAEKFFSSKGQDVDVLLLVNTGYGRCGVLWNDDEAIDLAKAVCQSSSLNLVGVLTHAGNAYGGPADEKESPREALLRAMNDERDRVISIAKAVVKACDLDGDRFEVSLGSTPSSSVFSNTKEGDVRVTEIRPGTYIFNDMNQVDLGSAKMKDCAVTVVATVVSVHREDNGTERLFIDAGKKVFTSDGSSERGYGTILHSSKSMTPLPHVKISNFSEEHGWITSPGGTSLSVGDRVRIVPHHVCVVVNTQDKMYLVDDEESIGELKVDARGKVW